MFSWLSSHLVTKQRASYWETFEGVGRHAEMKARVKKLLIERKDPKDRRRPPSTSSAAFLPGNQTRFSRSPIIRVV